MKIDSEEFKALVEKAKEFHGHLCSGLYIGVRMGLCAEKLLDVDRRQEYFMVETETDRCPTDGILVACSLSAGRRRFKMHDYGKCAASFFDSRTGKGVRLRFVSDLFPERGDDIVEYFESVLDEDLFLVEPVFKEYEECDLPGPNIVEVVCAGCGEVVQDHREVVVDDKSYCRTCYGKEASMLAQSHS